MSDPKALPPILHPLSGGSGDEEPPLLVSSRDRRSSASPRHRRRSRGIPSAIDAHARAPSISSSTNHSGSPHSVDTREEEEEDLEDADLTLPVLSPSGAAASSAPRNPDRPYFPHQPKSLAGIAVRSFGLGIALTVGGLGTLALLAYGSFSSNPSNSLIQLWRVPFFLATLSLFHFLEFWTTAAYNTRAAEVSSFLLTANWPGYAIAHALATLECLVTNILFPNRSWAPLHSGPLLCLLGLVLVAVGQTVRTVAMIQAGPSFNHLVQHQRSATHVLVTTGIYARLRHPSYFGFFWWALGTQLALGNLVCFFVYAAVLWKFFSSRIRREEEFLVRFFGDEYVDYRKKVGTKLPFVG